MYGDPYNIEIQRWAEVKFLKTRSSFVNRCLRCGDLENSIPDLGSDGRMPDLELAMHKTYLGSIVAPVSCSHLRWRLACVVQINLEGYPPDPFCTRAVDSAAVVIAYGCALRDAWITPVSHCGSVVLFAECVPKVFRIFSLYLSLFGTAQSSGMMGTVFHGWNKSSPRRAIILETVCATGYRQFPMEEDISTGGI
jgi:hypothetical protein